jgi:hypothetical protein
MAKALESTPHEYRQIGKIQSHWCYLVCVVSRLGYLKKKKGTVHINYRFLPTPLACRTFVMDRQERGQYTQMQAPHEEIIKESMDHRGVYSARIYVDISGNSLIPCNRGSFI